MHLRAIPPSAVPLTRPVRPCTGEFYPETLWRVLSSNDWFSSLDGATQDAIVATASLVKVAKGGIVERGATRGVLIGVVQGVLEIAQGASQHCVIADLLEPGRWFGWRRANTGEQDAFEVRALRPSTVLKIDGTALDRLQDAAPDMRAAMVSLQWDTTRRLLQRIDHISLPVYGERVRHTLLLLSQRFGEPAGSDWRSITVAFTQTEIAALARVSRARTNKVMSELAKSGLLRTSSGVLEISARLSLPLRAV